MLEQFSQKLVKNENDDVQISSRPLKPGSQRIKHDSSIAAVCISYCVTVLDKECGFVWLKEYRLAEFLKSNLYAEYKLSKVLSAAQVFSNMINIYMNMINIYRNMINIYMIMINIYRNMINIYKNMINMYRNVINIYSTNNSA